MYYILFSDALLKNASLITSGLLHEVFILLFLRNAVPHNWRMYWTEARKNGVASFWAIHIFLLSIVFWGERVGYTLPSYALLDLYWGYHGYTLRGVNALVLQDIRAAAAGPI
jgi:hypothetical protein